MSDGEILVRAKQTRELAKSMERLSETKPYDKNSLREYLSVSSGDARNELFTLNGDMDICVMSTCRLGALTAIFLENAAAAFEAQDKKIAGEMMRK